MIDNLKFRILNQNIINRLIRYPNLTQYKAGKSYVGYKINDLLRFDFRQSFENGTFAGYHHCEISVSPHYHFNNYDHNGNDFTPEQCRKTILEIFAMIGIQQNELKEFSVVNIEFGLNIIPAVDVKNIVNGIIYHITTPFLVANFPYNKITASSSHKRIKAYAKGIQFEREESFGINRNTFRFEVKCKKSVNIRKYGIYSATDLLNVEIYRKLANELLIEWSKVLIIEVENPISAKYNRIEKKYIVDCSQSKYWEKVMSSYRNKFAREKKKYYTLLSKTENPNTSIHTLLKEKFFSFGVGADLPLNNEVKKTLKTLCRSKVKQDSPDKKVVQISPHAHVIKCKSAPHHLCKVTGLDISMQKKGSKFLFNVGLEYYKDNDTKTYENIIQKFWSANCKGQNEKKMHTIIAHNIRNLFNNQKYSKKKSINPNQLEIFPS